MTSRSVVFAEPVRTAIGTFGGSLKDDAGNGFQSISSGRIDLKTASPG